MTTHERILLSVFVMVSVTSLDLSDVKAQQPGVEVGRRIKVDFDTTVTRDFLWIFRWNETERTSAAGWFLEQSDDSMTLKIDSESARTRNISIDLIHRVSRSVGQKRMTVTGLRNGALIGSIFLLMAYGPTSSSEPPPTEIDIEPNDRHPERGWIAFGATTLLGGVIGYFTRGDRWEKLDESEWKAGAIADPWRRFAGVGISCTF